MAERLRDAGLDPLTWVRSTLLPAPRLAPEDSHRRPLCL